MRALGIGFIVVACVLIALSRAAIRRAKRQNTKAGSWRAWFLLFLGFIAMIIGVVLW